MSTVQTFIRPVEVDALSGAATLPEPPASTDARAWSGWFEHLYKDAHGDAARIPWGRRKPSPSLVAWLNSEAPAMVRPGACVTVVGCGLGDDVRELADRGYDVTGFDVSATAVEWCRRLHPDLADRFLVADLLDVPASLRRKADLVVEISTIQAVHPELRAKIVAGVTALARPRGVVLAICRGREDGESLSAVAGPPFALSCGELTDLFAREGFAAVGGISDFEDGEAPPVRRLRAALRRA